MTSTSRGILRLLVPGVVVLDDFSDRLNHVWTCGLLLLMAALVGWRQQDFNNPIVCWVPVEFTVQLTAYVHAKCWATDKLYEFYLNEPYPISFEDSQDIKTIPSWLFKWLPIIMVFQALLFKFPNIFMNVLHGFSGTSFEKIEGLTKGYSQLNFAERSELGRNIGRYVYNWCVQCENCLPWRLLTITWFLVKVMYVCNVIVQLSLVDKLIGPSNPPLDVNSTTRPSYGDVLYDNFFNHNSTEWKSPAIFPRTVRCEYIVQPLRLRNINSYSHQCDLPINEFYEHVYMVLWLWLLIVAIISCLSLFVWILFILVPIQRQRYVARMLSLSEDLNVNTNTASINQLASTVGEDGVFVLKLIASNSSELLVKDVVMTMYQLKNSQYHTRYTPEDAQYPAASAPVPTTLMASDKPIKDQP